MKTRNILLALFCSTIAHAQSIIDQVFKTIVPETERAFYNFQSIDGQTKILGYGNGISNVYDEKWNTLENHNAGQEELNTGYYYLTRSYQYDSNRKTYTATAWEKTDYQISRQNMPIIFGLTILTNSIMERQTLFII